MPRDHYIAQFHLKEFLPPDSLDGQLLKYHHERGFVERKPVAELAQEPDFYPEAVDARMKEIEGLGRFALVDLARGDAPRDEQRVSQLLDYVALTICRSPFQLLRWWAYLGETSQRYPEHEAEWEEELRHETICESIFTKFFPVVRPILDQFSWNRIQAPESHPFFIADNPVIFAPVGRSGQPNRRSYVAMPLGRRVALLGCQNLGVMTKRFGRPGYLNLLSFLHAEEYVFSGQPIEEIEELLQAYDKWKKGPGSGVALPKARKPRPVLRRR